MRPSYRVVHSAAIWVLLLLLAFLPAYGPYMVYLEGALFPVTSKIDILSQQIEDDGLTIRFAYTKHRPCELVSASLRRGENEVGFYPVSSSSAPVTRLPGRQISRLWFVESQSLTGIDMWFVHRCSPLWLTATQVYP